jgi:gamma-glutamylcyclotransferase (GGCT)/AIG2-like uncharacterized protein YtfP
MRRYDAERGSGKATSQAMTMDFPLFAYGTLKSGFAAHARWLRGAHAPIAARCPGTLFLHPEGYPVLFIEPAAALAVGSSDIIADTRLAQRPEAAGPSVAERLAPFARAGSETSIAIRGELLTFGRGTLLLSELDTYEGFRPEAPSLFVRALVRIELLESHEPRHAWTYVAGPLVAATPLTRLSSDRWPD